MKNRISNLALLTAALLLAAAFAQENHDEHDPFAGVAIESLSSIEAPDFAGHALVLLRITLEPGAEIPAHGHPGAVALVVEQGTFTTRFTEGSGQVTRANGEGGEAQTATTESGSDIVLEPGDALAYDGHQAAHTMANGGDVPVVLLVSALLASDEPGFLFHEGH